MHIEWSHENAYSFFYIQITDRNFNTELQGDRLEPVNCATEANFQQHPKNNKISKAMEDS